MEDSKRIAVAGYLQVSEDGPEKCNSESDSENSDHGEELSGMYTSEMLGPRGKLNLTNAWLTAERANAPRAVAKVKVKVRVRVHSVPPAQIR
jgi:hypothetical protein